METQDVLKKIYVINKRLRELHLEINEGNFDKSTIHLEELDALCSSIEHMQTVSTNVYEVMKTKYNEKLVEQVRNM